MLDCRSGTTADAVCSFQGTATSCLRCGVLIHWEVFLIRPSEPTTDDWPTTTISSVAIPYSPSRRRESWSDNIRLRAHAWTPPPRPIPAQAQRRPLHGRNPHQVMRWKRRRFVQALRAEGRVA